MFYITQNIIKMLFITQFLNLGFVFDNIFGENCVQKYEFDFILKIGILFLKKIFFVLSKKRKKKMKKHIF